jgi:hypothetical protein
MFFKRLIKKYNAYKFVKSLQSKLEDDSFGFSDIDQKTIGCIVDESWCENDVLKDRLALLFNVNRAKITLLSIDTQVEDDYASTVAIKALTPNSKSIIDHPEVNFFIDKPFRILIQLYTADDIRIQWISAHTKSSFRIGLGTNNPRLCDLIINMDSYSCNEVLKEIEKYTSRLDVLKNE